MRPVRTPRPGFVPPTRKVGDQPITEPSVSVLRQRLTKSPGAFEPMKKGGKVKCMAKGGSASKRADGCATKGKTKGRMI